MAEFVNLYLVNGIVLGCVYGLGAIGITMIFGILRFGHFAHGDMMTSGAYIALALVWASGLPVLWVLPLAMVLTAALGAGVHWAFYRPLGTGTHSTIIIVIASFGVALMLRSAVQLFFGVDIVTYKRGFQTPILVFDTIRVLPRHLWIIGLTVVLVAALHLFLKHSRLGKAMRAMSDNPALARISGVGTTRVVIAAWVIGGALAAAGGVFLGIDTQLSSQMGWNLILPMFAAAVLGGIGNPIGAALGALVVGVAEELVTYPWFGDPLISPAYKSAVSFAILVGLLIWRPTGLTRGRVF
jgi:branched-subunit amino acid ABC-type transport system permease component